MTYIVYQITNIVNNKRYIGYSVNTAVERWRGHLEHASAARRGRCRPTRFSNAINKYGKDVFVREVLFEEDTLEGAKETEILTILDRDPEYNMTLGGDGLSGPAIENLRARSKGNKYAAGRVWREDSLKQLSESLKKSHAENPRVITDEWRENLSKAQTGRKHPQEVKDKISASNMGRGCTQRMRDAVAESNRRRKGEKRSPEFCMAQSERAKNRPPPSQETKDKISAALTGRKISQEIVEKAANSQRGKKRGTYNMTLEGSAAIRAGCEKRRGVKRGPYKKGKQKEAAIKRAATSEGRAALKRASDKAAENSRKKENDLA